MANKARIITYKICQGSVLTIGKVKFSAGQFDLERGRLGRGSASPIEMDVAYSLLVDFLASNSVDYKWVRVQHLSGFVGEKH